MNTRFMGAVNDPFPSRDERGSVLIIVIWIAFGLVSLALYFAHSMSFEMRAADNRVAGMKAEEAIAGAARYVSNVLANAQQPGASNCEFGALRNLDVIINFQRHSHATTAFANQPRTTRNLSNSRAGEQDIGAFQKSARIVEANCQGVICLETLSQPTELHQQRA